MMKDIPGYEGLYAATEDGQIWSYRSKKFLQPGKKPKQDYLVCSLSRGGHRRTYHIHSLICDTFKPKPAAGLTIDHIDEDGTNNSIDNLEWVTIEENLRRRFTHHYTMAIECVETGERWWTQKEAAAALRVSDTTICNHFHGRNKSIGVNKVHLRRVKVDGKLYPEAEEI